MWRENMHGYLSADIICSIKRTVYRERSPKKTVNFEEQIVSRENVQAHKIEAIVFSILKRFCNAREKLFTNCMKREMISLEYKLYKQ